MNIRSNVLLMNKHRMPKIFLINLPDYPTRITASLLQCNMQPSYAPNKLNNF